MQKSKAIQNIETRMGDLDPSSFRYRVLGCARDFKSSWIELGQCLYAVYKDKQFKDWGYLTFEAYCAKEVGIRQATAVKMLKSYSFLEREEPSYLKEDAVEKKRPLEIPSFEAVNALRLAHESEKLTEREYEDLREDVFEEGKEDGEVKKKIRYILKSKPQPGREEVSKEDKRDAVLKRLASQLDQARRELDHGSVPPKILKQLDTLAELLADYRGPTLE